MVCHLRQNEAAKLPFQKETANHVQQHCTFKNQLTELVRGSVENTLHDLLEADIGRLRLRTLIFQSHQKIFEFPNHIDYWFFFKPQHYSQVYNHTCTDDNSKPKHSRFQKTSNSIRCCHENCRSRHRMD